MAPKEEAKEAPKPEAPPEPPKKKKKIRRIPLKVDQKPVGMTEKEMMDAQEHEGNMAHADKLVAETSEAMNELESFVYSIRDQLATRYEKFSTEDERSKMGTKLTEMEDWLYEDGADAEKAVYVAKLAELNADVASIIMREREDGERPDAFKALEAAIAKYSEFVASADEEYAHIEKEQKDKVGKECEAAKAFVAQMQAKLEGLAPTSDPPFKAAELSAKAAELAATCEPIMRTPKPLPKVEPAPEPAPAADAPAADAPAADVKSDATAEGAAPVPDNMDVD